MKIERLPATQYLCRQFPEFEVEFASRPDGNLVMTLSDREGAMVACRVVQLDEQQDAHLLDSLVSRIRRDLATEEGPLQPEDVDHFKEPVQLQNFHESSEPLRKRRIVNAGQKLRALAHLSA
ncbi:MULTISPECIES: DUF3509 domain-containing protein [Pseudomonas]|uniref:DUF3509 domain-containing protein n=1 Tax=Pseudomonas TaxID=286 RepID=UPI0023D82220|nr:DUF3509 domain-containing protein [Pseudomonas sp. PSE14]WEJ70227.1 DUF3509 domain-containing protein [Pseudomonas sp. PSE14]